MTIAEARTSCKAALGRIRSTISAYILGLPRDVLIVGALLLACIASFSLGTLVGQGMGSRGPAAEAPKATVPAAAAAVAAKPGQVVASRNGTRYYYPSCSGVSRIASANIVAFASASAAEAAGYTLAAGCTSK